MATYVKFQLATEKMVEAGNMGSDTWAVCLTNTAPTVASDTTVVAEVANGNGYTTGGNSCAVSTAVSTAGVYKLVLADPAAWTATGAGFTFRYAILYNATQTQCWGYWDYASSQLVAAGETLTVDLSAANGVFTVS